MSTCTVPSWYLREEDPYVVFLNLIKSDTNAIQLNKYDEMSTCTVPSWYLREEDKIP